ncbi:MAG: hypothetical protein ACPL3Q_09760 [Candidatus Ratteibacteria bacterium]
MQLCEYTTNLAYILFGSEDKVIDTELQMVLAFDSALTYILITNSGNLSYFLFRITDVPEDYREEMERTLIEKGWKVSRTLVEFFLEIDFSLLEIHVNLVGRGRMSNQVFISVPG